MEITEDCYNFLSNTNPFTNIFIKPFDSKMKHKKVSELKNEGT